jgi:hypothetical protein
MRPIVAFAAACLTAFATAAPASSGGPAIPSFLTFRNDGIIFVYVNSTRGGTLPACATFGSGSYFRYAFDSKTPEGKSMLAGLLAAHANGENIWIRGTGDCGVFPDTESLLNFNTAT